MAQTKHQIQALLAQAQTRPRHRFGQNFMVDQNLVRLVAQAAGASAGQLVIEVGPGTGTLTEELLKSGADVLAVEVDRDLAAMLRSSLGNQPRFALIEGDALGRHKLNAELSAAIATALGRGTVVRLCANLPYNIASPLVIELLLAGVQHLAFTVQKEVADRLRAAPGSEHYGTLSIMAQLLADVEVLRTLPPSAFWPAPQVNSALVRMMRHDRLGPHGPDLHRLLCQLFSMRRKTLRKSLGELGIDAGKVLGAMGLDPQIRPEMLSPQQHLRLLMETGRACAMPR